jgi:hypothetical protein
MEIGRSRIILGRVVSIFIEDKFVDPAGPYVLAEELHAIGRMNGLGSYVKTRNSFLTMPRIPYEEWKKGVRQLIRRDTPSARGRSCGRVLECRRRIPLCLH